MAYRVKIEIVQAVPLFGDRHCLRIELTDETALGALARVVAGAMSSLRAEQSAFLAALRELKQAQSGLAVQRPAPEKR